MQMQSAQVGSTLVCKLYPARYGRAKDVIIASLSGCTQQLLAQSRTQSWSQSQRDQYILFGLVYNNMSGLA